MTDFEGYTTTYHHRFRRLQEWNKTYRHSFVSQKVVSHTTIDIKKTSIWNSFTLSTKDKIQTSL